MLQICGMKMMTRGGEVRRGTIPGPLYTHFQGYSQRAGQEERMWALPEKYTMHFGILSIYFLPSPFVPKRKEKPAWEK